MKLCCGFRQSKEIKATYNLLKLAQTRQLPFSRKRFILGTKSHFSFQFNTYTIKIRKI